MKKILAILVFALSINSFAAKAQMFEASADWEDNERTIAIGKWSQLYYELNVGWNITKDNYTNKADFLYFGLGVGFPTLENAWRKFLPAQKIPDNEDEAELFGSMDTKDGLCFNLWKHLHVQGGVTYMWKEIPLLTVGIGANF